MSFDARTAHWEVVPNIGLMETYTDNVALAAKGLERSDFVTQVTPALRVAGTGARLRFLVDYGLQERLYANTSSANGYSHLLNASAHSELFRRFMFADAGASITQQNASLLAPQGIDNTNLTANRADVKTWYVTPYLKNRFSTFAEYELRYRLDQTSVSSTNGNGSAALTSSLSDTRRDQVIANLNSGSQFQRLRWRLSYSDSRTHQENVQDIDLKTYGGVLTYFVTPQLGLTGAAGYDADGYQTAGVSNSGTYYSAGAEWNPTPRTHLAGSVGHRYYGPSRSLDFKQRSARTTWSLNYVDEVTTTSNLLTQPITFDTASIVNNLFVANIPDPIERARAVQSFIAQNGLPASLLAPVNFFTNQVLLSKRLTGSMAVNGRRNTILASVFRQTSESQQFRTAVSSPLPAFVLPGLGDFALSSVSTQTGANIAWTSHITRTITSVVNVGFTRTDFPDVGRVDDNAFVLLGLQRQFSPRVSGSLNYRFSTRESSTVGNDFRENAVIAMLGLQY